jgi:hypothetical protein
MAENQPDMGNMVSQEPPPEDPTAAESREELRRLLEKFGQAGLEPGPADAGVAAEPALAEPAPEPAPAEIAPAAATTPSALEQGPVAGPEAPLAVPPEEKERTFLERALDWCGARVAELDAHAERLGLRWLAPLLGESIKHQGDQYNKMRIRDKMVLAAAFSGLATIGAIGVAASAPLASLLVLAGTAGLLGQRFSGFIGMYNKFEHFGQNAEQERANQERPGWYRYCAARSAALDPRMRKLTNLTAAAAYTLLVGALFGEAIYLGAQIPELLGQLLGHKAELAAQEAISAVQSPPVAAPAAHVEAGMGGPHLAAADHALPQHAAPPGAPPAEHPVPHHPSHHHALSSAAAREHLETDFLNQWQLDHPGTMPSHDEIEAYLAAHAPGGEHTALHEVRARLGLARPPAGGAFAGAPFHVGEAQIPQDLHYHGPAPEAHIPSVPETAPSASAAPAQPLHPSSAFAPGTLAPAPAPSEAPAPLPHAPAPAGPEHAASAPEAGSGAQVNAFNLPVDSAHAHEYVTQAGDKVVFGGTEAERAQKAAEWVASDHKAVVYYESSKRSFLGFLSKHLTKVSWSEIVGKANVHGVPGHDIAVGQAISIDDTDPGSGLTGARLPVVDDLYRRVDIGG